MRRFILSLFAIITASCAFAQTSGTMVVRQTDGTSLEVKVANIEKVYFKEDEPEPTVEYVDLGLSVKWATCNLGASAPEEYGDYYGWGCTKPYQDTDNVDWTLYFQMIGGSGTSYDDCGTDKDPLKDYVNPNHKSIAGTQWDAARSQLGGKWRMPTTEEQNELLDNCIWTWTTTNGVNGYLVTGSNGNSIFLPAAGDRNGSSLNDAGFFGYCWGSTPYAGGSDFANHMSFFSGYHKWGHYYRFDGYPIRPVCE